MSKLITASLISSVDWLKKCPSNWKDKAYQDLFNQLARVYPKEIPMPIKRGIEFETTVQSQVESGRWKDVKSSEHFKKVCSLCAGGEFQVKSKSYITVRGVEYCLYGKIDNKFSDLINDLKATGNFKKDSYTKSFQHKIYCHNEQIKNFNYIVAEFEKESMTKIKEVHEVPIHIADLRQNEQEIKDKIIEVIDFISCDDELLELYNKSFCKYS
jgi:hypothetical protein